MQIAPTILPGKALRPGKYGCRKQSLQFDRCGGTSSDMPVQFHLMPPSAKQPQRLIAGLSDEERFLLLKRMSAIGAKRTWLCSA
jgi:hypothetical protein